MEVKVDILKEDIDSQSLESNHERGITHFDA